jgi:hypothetical protein
MTPVKTHYRIPYVFNDVTSAIVPVSSRLHVGKTDGNILILPPLS